MSNRALLTQIKNQKHYTNSMVFENDLFDENNHCRFETQQEEGFFCFFKDTDCDFKHLNFFVTENQLEQQDKIEWNQKNFVAEIITANNAWTNQVNNWLQKQDVFHYRTFFRILRTDKTKFNFDYSKVQQPEDDDLEEIIRYLEDTFDKHTERIPTLQKLKQLQKSCYLIKENNQIAAVLVTEFKGKNQELNFMVTLPKFEGKGYGSILMTYVFNNPEVQRWIIWVDQSNLRAVEWYYKIGYKKDKLVNNIYLSKKIMNDKIHEILVDTRDEFDFSDPTIDFIKAGYLDSFDIISLIVDLENAFDVKISGALIVPENFKSIDAIMQLIQRSKDASQV